MYIKRFIDIIVIDRNKMNDKNDTKLKAGINNVINEANTTISCNNNIITIILVYS